MKQITVGIVALGSLCAANMMAQQRQAAITGGGSPDRGKCTVEVVVDGSAEVEVRGASANLRTLQGQPAQWRRFQCTGPMPANGNIRFAGVDGRGRQQLVRDPRNGGVAVVRIEDSSGGAEGYTFDLTWDSGNPGYNGEQRGPGFGQPPPPPQYGERQRPDDRDSEYYRQNGRPFGTDEAVRVCQQQVFDQVSRRYNTRDIHFTRTGIDDNPGRQDWVIGTVDVRRRGREEHYHFSCSVNFGNGRVRSAEVDPRPLDSRR